MNKKHGSTEEQPIPIASEPTAPYGNATKTHIPDGATHFFDGENYYVTRQYYEDYIFDMADAMSHPENNEQKQLRVAQDGELADCITLDEWDKELTGIIHRHYHPEG